MKSKTRRSQPHRWPRPDSYDCPTGKQGYRRKTSARQMARKLSKDSLWPYRPYRCDVCRLWHVGGVSQWLRD